MESILTLYRTGIDPSRNLLIDSLDDYLAACESLRVEAFSLVRPVAEGEIKAALPQLMSVDPKALAPYDYLTVKQGGTTWRYYVSKLEQLATDTVKLHIALDALNTIRPSDQDFSPLSHCARSLRNRYDGNNRPITDFSNEGIEATLVKTSETEFPMREGFLVYSMAEGQPPSLFAVYDSATPVSNIAEITSDGFFRHATLHPRGEASNPVWPFKRPSIRPEILRTSFGNSREHLRERCTGSAAPIPGTERRTNLNSKSWMGWAEADTNSEPKPTSGRPSYPDRLSPSPS